MSKTDPFLIVKTILKDYKVPLDSISNHDVVFYEKIEIPAHIIRIAFGAIDIYPIDFNSTGIIWSLHFTYGDSLYTIESRKNGLILVGGKENVSQKETILKKINSSAKVIDNNLKKFSVFFYNSQGFQHLKMHIEIDDRQYCVLNQVLCLRIRHLDPMAFLAHYNIGGST